MNDEQTTRPRVTREEAIQRAGARLAGACARLDVTPAREAAQAAWSPGGPSVDELEARIRADRGER